MPAMEAQPAPMSYSTWVLGRVSPQVLMCKLVGKFARPRKTRKRVLQREETAFAKTRKVRWTVLEPKDTQVDGGHGGEILRLDCGT